MPPPPRIPGQCAGPHHLVWVRDDPLVKITCAHCSFVSARLNLTATTGSVEVDRLVESSRGSHAQLCDRHRRPTGPGRRSRWSDGRRPARGS